MEPLTCVHEFHMHEIGVQETPHPAPHRVRGECTVSRYVMSSLEI